MPYIPTEEEREVFERYLEREGIENDDDIQEAWLDYRDELEDRHFNSGRAW